MYILASDLLRKNKIFFEPNLMINCTSEIFKTAFKTGF